MKNTLAELNSLVARWETLRKQRPSDTDFSQWWPGITADDLDSLFATWKEELEISVAKTRTAEDPEEKIIDATVAKLLREARPHLDSAASNGIPWIIQNTPFPNQIASAGNYLLTVLGKRTSVRRGLIKLAGSQLNEEILTVEKAAPLASELIGHHKKIAEQNENIETALEALEETTTQLEKMREEATEHEAAITILLDAVKLKSSEVENLSTKVSDTVSDANEVLDEVKEQKAEADKTIKTGTELLTQANLRLTKALQDINRQALAGAFHEKASSAATERWVWVGAFAFSIIWLAIVGYHIRESLATSKDIFDWAALLRGMPMAGPAIWLGWFAAKQSGMLARIQQDYDYKAATAVAFEGYKKEVAAAKDDDLSKQLLETAVHNFGENPIRLYDKHKDEHVLPVEALLAKVKDDGTWGRLIDLIKALTPERKP